MVCTFVIFNVDGGGGLLALLTKPEQPLKSAAEQLRITAPTAHTHPLTSVLTFITFSGLGQLVSWGGGWGPSELAAQSCPNSARRIRRGKHYYYWYGEQFWCRGRSKVGATPTLAYGQGLIGR